MISLNSWKVSTTFIDLKEKCNEYLFDYKDRENYMMLILLDFLKSANYFNTK